MLLTPLVCCIAEDKHSRLKEMIGGLSEAVYNIKREQALMEVRDHTHKQSTLVSGFVCDIGKYLLLCFGACAMPTIFVP